MILRLQRIPNTILELAVNTQYLFILDLKMLVCLLVTIVLYVDYFTLDILNNKSYYAAGQESQIMLPMRASYQKKTNQKQTAANQTNHTALLHITTVWQRLS